MKLDQERIASQTRISRVRAAELRQNLERYDADSAKDHRKARRLCRSCYYLTNNGGLCAITESSCENCGRTIQNPNTNINRYCKTCSVEHEVCAKCGSEIDA